MSGTTIKKSRSFPIDIQDILVVIFAAAIVIMNSRIISSCYNPFVYNDEAGYWTHAFTMAGYDLRGYSSTLAWYSYGYSIMLVPLIKFIHDPVTLYRAALVLNVVLTLAVYFMYIYILRYLFPKLKKAETAFASAAAVLYASYQAYSGIAFSEIALLFTFTASLFMLVRIMKKPTCLNSACFGALSAYLFMIHNRAIGITAASAIVMAAAFLMKKIDKRQVSVFFISLVSGLMLDRVICHFLSNYLWPEGKPSGNDTGSMSKKFTDAFSSWDGIKRVGSLIASQAFAGFAATFCISLFALWAMGRRIVSSAGSAAEGIKKKKKRQLARTVDERSYVLAFIFMAFVFTLIISAFFMFDFKRIDHVVYTRYYDIVMGVLIMCGLCFLLEADHKDMVFIAAVPLIMFGGANRAKALMNSVVEPVFNRVCSPGICWYYDDFRTGFYNYAAVAAGIFGGIVLITQIIKKRNIALIAASILTASLFIYYSDAAKACIYSGQEGYTSNRELALRSKDIEGAKFYAERGVGAKISMLQYIMYDHRIDLVDKIDDFGSNDYVFTSRRDLLNIVHKYEPFDISDDLMLCRVLPKEQREQPLRLPLSFMNVHDEECYVADEDMIKSSPESYYVCYGPYLNIKPDNYLFDFVMQVNGDAPETMGYAEIRSHNQEETYAHCEMKSDMIGDDGRLLLELPAEIDKKTDDLEIIVFLYDPSALELELDSIFVNTEE